PDGSGVRIYVVHVTEGLGGDVVVEVQEHAPPVRRRHVRTEAIVGARIGRDRHVEGSSGGQRLFHLGGPTQEAEVVGEIVGIVDGDLAAQFAQRGGERQRRTERVAVGAAVHGDEDPAGGPQRVDGKAEV